MKGALVSTTLTLYSVPASFSLYHSMLTVLTVAVLPEVRPSVYVTSQLEMVISLKDWEEAAVTVPLGLTALISRSSSAVVALSTMLA